MLKFISFRNIADCFHSHGIRNGIVTSSKASFNDVAVTSNSKRIGLTKGEQLRLVKQRPIQPENPKLIKISMIGAPNAGKSTLSNKLIGWRFSSVSEKVHTTRHNCIGVLTEGGTQMVFLDTPGMITSKKKKLHHLEGSLLRDPHTSLFDADVIAVVHDVSTTWGSASLDKDILATLELHNPKKTILILNKVDLVPIKQRILSITRNLTENIIQNKVISSTVKSNSEEYKEKLFLQEIFDENIDEEEKSDTSPPDWMIWRSSAAPLDENTKLEYFSSKKKQIHQNTNENMEIVKPINDQEWTSYHRKFHSIKKQLRDKKGWAKFDQVFMVSALEGDGVEEIKNYLMSSAYDKPWIYHKNLVTNADPLEIAKMCVREKVLNHLRKEAPYVIEVVTTHWEIDENNMLWSAFDIICTTNRYVSAALGKNGQSILAIAAEAKQDLMNTFKQEMSLKLTVKLKSKS